VLVTELRAPSLTRKTPEVRRVTDRPLGEEQGASYRHVNLLFSLGCKAVPD